MIIQPVVCQARAAYRRPGAPGYGILQSTRSLTRWATKVAVAALGLVLVAQALHADTRLEAHRFGNIDPQRLSENYPDLDTLLADAHVIPGLHENFVPQGIELLDSDEVVLSGYFCERFTSRWRTFIRRCAQKRSAFYLFDRANGEAVRLALLEERNGEPMRRHAAGVAELHDRLWLPGKFEVLRFDLSQFRNAEKDVITLRPENEQRIGVDSNGDFITAFGDSLWIGNFQRGRLGDPLPMHYPSGVAGTRGWTAGYHIDPDTLRPATQAQYNVGYGGYLYKVYRPDAALRHGNNVQGMSFIDEHHVVLSTSYGARLSTLTFHELPFPPLRSASNGEETMLPDDSVLWIQALSSPTRKASIAAPPGAEGVAHRDDMLIVAFEGGALPYRARWSRIEDRMMLLRPPEHIAR